jgi:hypothetical protein
MTLPEHIARCEREIQQCREAAAAADNAIDRYGLTWAEVDWLVAKQVYEDELAAAGGETHANENPEGEDGFRIGC